MSIKRGSRAITLYSEHLTKICQYTTCQVTAVKDAGVAPTSGIRTTVMSLCSCYQWQGVIS